MWIVETVCECGEVETVEAEEFSFALVCPKDWTAFSYEEWVYKSAYCPACSLQLQELGAEVVSGDRGDCQDGG